MRRVACYALAVAAYLLICWAGALAFLWLTGGLAEARGGQAEVVMPDRTRCDCLTASHAVEVDFAKKWAEGIGQSLHYSRLTGRRAGLLLIIERPSDWRYVRRVEQLRSWLQLPLDVYTVEAGR